MLWLTWKVCRLIVSFSQPSMPLTRIFHESLAATTNMGVLPGVLGCRSLRRTGQVRLGIPRYGCQARGASACAARGTPILVVSRQQLKIPAACCRESSKCKVFIPFYCSSLANPRPARKAGLRDCARLSIFMKYPG